MWPRVAAARRRVRLGGLGARPGRRDADAAASATSAASSRGASSGTRTTLAPAYDPAAIEAVWYARWTAANAFAAPSAPPPRSPDAEAPRRCTVLFPPANVTGQLHIGHALTCTLEDVLVRWRRMKGDAVWWVPGTDHAGIATQTVVERRLWATERTTRHDLGRDRFLDAVWAWKDQYGGRINQQLRRLGASMDWNTEYFTMDSPRSAFVTEAFVRLHDAGLVHRATRMINWCCHLRTVISDIEVDTVQVPGRTALRLPGRTDPVTVGVIYHVAYPLAADADGADPQPGLVVATTRPETILGDVAVAVHPDDPRYRALLGRHLVNPVTGTRIPVVGLAGLVDPAFGTGAVKVTPAHDPADHAAATAANLDLGVDILRDDGTLSDAVPPPYRGLDRFAARDAVLGHLRTTGRLVATLDHAMTLSVCSRSGDLLEPRLKPQWFVRTGDLAARAAAAARTGSLEIVPAHFGNDWQRWLGQARDWCISRQLWWGHRIPAYRLVLRQRDGQPVPWSRVPPAVRRALTAAHAGRAARDDDDGEAPWLVARSVDEARRQAADLVQRAAGDAAGPGWSADVAQDPDVLDTWFSSALLPLSATAPVGEPPEATLERVRASGAPPLAFLETGGDILFFWVARMVMLCQHLTGGTLPFARVLLHPVVRDAQGRKMSKSLGNVIDPVDIMDGVTLAAMVQQLEQATLPAAEIRAGVADLKARLPSGIPACGADALRLALAQYPQQSHFLNLDTTRIVTARLFGNKLWNVTKFVCARLAAPSGLPHGPQQLAWAPAHTLALPPRECPTRHVLDRWLLHRLARTMRAVEAGLAAFDLHIAADAIQDWFHSDLCDFYVEAFKARRFGAGAPDGEAAAAVAVLAGATETGLRALHPFMPFVTEHLWQALRTAPEVACADAGSALLVHASFPSSTLLASYDAPAEVEETVRRARAVVHAVRALRQNLGVPPTYAGAIALTVADANAAAALAPLVPLLGRMARAPGLRMCAANEVDRTKSSLVAADAVTEVALDLGALPDVGVYLSRLVARQHESATALRSLQDRLERDGSRVPGAVLAKWETQRASLVQEGRQLQADVAALRAAAAA